MIRRSTVPTIGSRLLLASIVVLSSLLSAPQQAHAERLESESYVIQFGNFNITSGQKSSDNYSVTDTVGQIGAGPYGQYGVSGYFLGGGFQYIYQIDEFFFRISKLHIDFGTLIAGSHSTDSHILSIGTRNQGYRVYAYELHPLQHSSGNFEIPDTTCDAGTCSETTAGIWSDQAQAGFGFNISGDDVPLDFVNNTYFRQFANQATSENMQVVMSSANAGTNKQATVTYKAGITGTQATGNYETSIVFVAVPEY